MNDIDNRGFLTAKQVARRFQVSERTIRRWTDDGKLRCIKIGSGTRFTIRYREKDLEAFARQHSQGGEGH